MTLETRNLLPGHTLYALEGEVAAFPPGHEPMAPHRRLFKIPTETPEAAALVEAFFDEAGLALAEAVFLASSVEAHEEALHALLVAWDAQVEAWA